MIKKHKAWYLYCDQCQCESFEFHKDDAEHFMETHNCEKYLKRRLLNGSKVLAENFDIVITKNEAAL